MALSPVEPALQPVLRAFRMLRRAVDLGFPQHVSPYRDSALREMGNVKGPSPFLLMAANQLRSIRGDDLTGEQLSALECLVFGGRVMVETDGVIGIQESPNHPLEPVLQQMLAQLAVFFSPALYSRRGRLESFIAQHRALLSGLFLLRDALALPSGDFLTLMGSDDPRIREWAQAALQDRGNLPEVDAVSLAPEPFECE